MDFLDDLRRLVSRHASARFAQLVFDPLFLIGSIGLIVLVVVLIVLAAS